MGAVEEWENHCRDQAWYLDHMHGGELHHHRLALAAIAELQEERRVPAITADTTVDLYPAGWATDRLTAAHLAEKLTDAAEAARGSGQVAILKDETGGREIAAIVPLNVLNSPPSVPEHLPEIPETDLRVDLYRSGPNTGSMRAGVYQGVRLTHLPTGLTAESAGERSQLQNKANALASLRGQLAEREKDLGQAIGGLLRTGADVGPPTLAEAVEVADQLDQCIGRALAALEDGIYDGENHKDWVIDQAVRRLLGCPEEPATGRAPTGEEYSYTRLGTNDAYRAWLAGHEGWNEGVAP